MSRRVVPLSYLLLASVYLLYWPDAEFVLDDWFQFQFYSQHPLWEVLRTLLQNKLYSTFQLFWLSCWVDALAVKLLGYAPRVFFTLAVLVHVINAWLLCRLASRLRVNPVMAWLAGALFVLIPTAHGPLFWNLATGFYRLSLLLLLMYFISLVENRPAWQQGLLAAAVLFTGGAIQFCLLLFGGPWLAVCLVPREKWKGAARSVGLCWAVMALGLAIYVPFINRIPPSQGQIQARYDFSRDFLVNNWRKFYAYHLPGMSSFGPHAFYRLRATAPQLLAAAGAALLVLFLARRRPTETAGRAPGRIALFAAGLMALAYGPLIYLIGGTLRHYYTLSPYLSLLLAALCWMLPSGRAVTGAVLAAYFAACTVAEIQQCWQPMSRQAQELKAGLRQLRNLVTGDPVVVPGTPGALGAAPNFTGASGPWDRRFAEVVIGVEDLEFWREIVIEKGRPRLFRQGAMRDTSVAELGRAHVLVGGRFGPYQVRRYWAGPDGLHCLKDVPCTEPPPAGADHDQVYFAKPFEHGNIDHLHY